MRTRMKKLALLLLSLLVLAALGLVACGGGDDEDSATAEKASADTTTEATAPPDTTTEAKLSVHARHNIRAQMQELKAKLPQEQVQELKRDANTEAKLSPEQVQALEREANEWARDFSRGGVCDKYTGQPICMALTPVSEAFQESFAGATVEDIESERIELAGWTDRPLYVAAVRFSNGEVVVFSGGDESFTCAGGGDACIWSLADEDHNRRFIQAATNTDNKYCGRFGHRYKLAVVKGDVSCRRARRVLRGYVRPPAGTRLPGSWSCHGDDSRWVCVNEAGKKIVAWWPGHGRARGEAGQRE